MALFIQLKKTILDFSSRFVFLFIENFPSNLTKNGTRTIRQLKKANLHFVSFLGTFISKTTNNFP